MTTPSTPRELLESLDADQLRHRLDELDRERAAIIVLLRAARARRRRRRPDGTDGEEARHE
jgi:hypothetical protein